MQHAEELHAHPLLRQPDHRAAGLRHHRQRVRQGRTEPARPGQGGPRAPVWRALAIFGWPEMWNGERAAQADPRIRRRGSSPAGNSLQDSHRHGPRLSQPGRHRLLPEFRRLAMEGKFAIVMSMLNAYPLGDDLSQLDKWAARGVHVRLQLCRQQRLVFLPCRSSTTRRMPWAASPARQAGGRTAQRSRGDHRRLADVDQGPGTGRRPQPCAHRRLRRPRALVDIKRNLSDHEMQLIKGGVIQVVGFPPVR